jgi:hypothetical protein
MTRGSFMHGSNADWTEEQDVSEATLIGSVQPREVVSFLDQRVAGCLRPESGY